MERLTISGGKIGFYNDVINKCSNKDIPSVRKQLNESKRTYEIEEYKYKEYSTDELKAIYNRLAELEDKLENGQLVELPCKIGDTLYVPWVYDGQADIMKLTVSEITLSANNITFICSDFETDVLEFKNEYNNGNFDIKDFNIVWFTDKLQAETKLKELKDK